ncbi:MAG: hypothetical protein KDA92_01065 [Planctomycetales bacterium]|nr:hypothetical protein [Planctomycetales bacterium]
MLVHRCGGSGLAGKIKGKVVAISSAGDAVTDISCEQLRDVPRDEQVSIQCEGHMTSCIFPADHGQPEMTFLARIGETGFLELSLVGDSVNTFLCIRPESVVTVKW